MSSQPDGDKKPLPQLYRSPKVLWVATVVALVIAAFVVVLLTGSSEPVTDAGDAEYIIGGGVPEEGARGPEIAASAADIVSSEVTAENGELLFTALVEAPLPDRYRQASLAFTWDVESESGDWAVSARLEKGLSASVVSTERGYAAVTRDETLPGSVATEGHQLRIRLRTSDIPGFPSSFRWKLSAVLTAFEGVPDSPRVEDGFPDSGARAFP